MNILFATPNYTLPLREVFKQVAKRQPATSEQSEALLHQDTLVAKETQWDESLDESFIIENEFSFPNLPIDPLELSTSYRSNRAHESFINRSPQEKLLDRYKDGELSDTEEEAVINHIEDLFCENIYPHQVGDILVENYADISLQEIDFEDIEDRREYDKLVRGIINGLRENNELSNLEDIPYPEWSDFDLNALEPVYRIPPGNPVFASDLKPKITKNKYMNHSILDQGFTDEAVDYGLLTPHRYNLTDVSRATVYENNFSKDNLVSLERRIEEVLEE